MTPADQIARGEQAKVALEHFLDPAFNLLSDTYLARLAEVAAEAPIDKALAQQRNLALALKIVKIVRSQIGSLVADGEIAARRIKHDDRIANLPHQRRRWLG